MKMMLVLASLLLVSGSAVASDVSSVGLTSEPGEVIGGGLDECTGTLEHHHDNSFENGYAWRNAGVAPPYYGSFGEGYSTGGPVSIECIALWLSDLGYWYDATTDVYIWEGGVTSEPGAVLSVLYDHNPGAPATWPDVSQHDVDIPDYLFAGGEITVGSWGNWPGAVNQWYWAADLDGPQGNPWTCMAPGSGYGTGWLDPSIVWGETRSMGCGFYHAEITPVESRTWGSIKGLFE